MPREQPARVSPAEGSSVVKTPIEIYLGQITIREIHENNLHPIGPFHERIRYLLTRRF